MTDKDHELFIENTNKIKQFFIKEEISVPQSMQCLISLVAEFDVGKMRETIFKEPELLIELKRMTEIAISSCVSYCEATEEKEKKSVH